MANRTVTVKSSGLGDYASLNAALSGESKDLVTNTQILTIECYSMEDTTHATTGTGYTTSSSYYIKIYVPASERHDGKWNDTKYRMNYAGWDNVLNVEENYTEIDGIQSTGSHTSGCGNNIYTSIDYITVKNCVLTRTATAAKAPTMLIMRFGTVFNCIMDRGDTGVSTAWKPEGNNVTYIYNCTVSNCSTYGIVTNTGTHTIKNCAVFNTPNDFHNDNGTNTISYCASDDGDGTNAVNISPNATEADDWANCFVDYANQNFHLKSGSVCINAGEDLSSIFTTDIDGETRPTGAGTWDIGADEYVAASVKLLLLNNTLGGDASRMTQME